MGKIINEKFTIQFNVKYSDNFVKGTKIVPKGLYSTAQDAWIQLDSIKRTVSNEIAAVGGYIKVTERKNGMNIKIKNFNVETGFFNGTIRMEIIPLIEEDDLSLF